MIEICRDTPGLTPDPRLAHARLGDTVRTEPPVRVILHDPPDRPGP